MADGTVTPFEESMPTSNVLGFYLEDGTLGKASGTEPKIKFYFESVVNISDDDALEAGESSPTTSRRHYEFIFRAVDADIAAYDTHNTKENRMADFSPFRGWRPPAHMAGEVASESRTQYRRACAIISSIKKYDESHSSDGELPVGTSLYSETAYRQAANAFCDLIDSGLLIEDESPHFYVYAQQMGTHRQVGLMGSARPKTI